MLLFFLDYPETVEWNWIQVKVNGDDFTSYLTPSEQVATLPMRSEIGRASLSFRDDGSMPSIGMWGTITLHAGIASPGTVIWGGCVNAIMLEPQSIHGGSVSLVSVDAQDFSVLLTANEPISERYGGGSNESVVMDYEIVDDLISTYLLPFYDAGSISSSNPVQCDYIQFDNETLRSALNKINERSGKDYGISAGEQFFWRPSNVGTVAHELSESPDYVTTFPMRAKPYYDADGIDQRNAVRVIGGWRESAAQTETFTTDGILYQFQVDYFPQTIISVDLGGISQTVGVYLVDDPADFDVLVWYDQRKFIYQLPPASGKTLTIVYRYPLRVEETVEDAASQAALGLTLWAPTISDASISSVDVAQMIGSAYLARSTAAIERAQVTTTWVGTAGPYLAGQVLKVSATALSWSSKLLQIQNVTARFVARGDTSIVMWDLDLGTPFTVGRSLADFFQNDAAALRPLNYVPLILT